jgi:CHAT domain-containing protein
MRRVVSSYTPTLRALRESRDADNSIHEDDRFLVLAIEEDDGLPDLPGALEERDALRGLLPGDRLTVLGKGGATRADVLAALPQHRWVHFGCHADQDLRDPSSGGLLLSDGILTVAEISDHRFRGDFAGLAACKTAVGGLDLLDESITLAAAMHFMGYRHVIASLWSIDDTVSTDVFTGLYRRLVRDGIMDTAQSAVALHELILEQRRLRPNEALSWAPFIHLGP